MLFVSEKRNRDHVAIVVGDARRWILHVPATAQTFEGQRREAMQLGSDVCTALESIFTPTSVEYATREVEEGSVSDVRACTFGEPNRPIITNQQKGVSSNLRNAQELRSDVLYDIEQTCESEACFVNQLEIRGKTKLTLADTTQWLDQRSEERVKLYNRTRLVGTASEDPLYIKVKYRK